MTAPSNDVEPPDNGSMHTVVTTTTQPPETPQKPPEQPTVPFEVPPPAVKPIKSAWLTFLKDLWRGL